ncbi:MAG: hypothetical protein FJ278_00950, partial [Planctomycetes bacterium]|nr:hypothetical protein [Planctomycetota bacterium]
MARLRLMHLGAVLACLSQAAYSLEMKTSDSLLVRMSDQTGHIEAMSISGEAVPLLGAAHPLRVREFKPDALRKNLVPNPGLEAEEGWPFLGEGAARVSEFNHTLNGKYCGKVAAPAGATGAAPATSGQFRSVSFPAKPNTRYLLRAWGLVPQGSSGGNMFVVELDQNGKILLRDNYWHIQHSLGWREIAEGKWVEKELSFTTQPHCAEFHIYANIWKGYGVFYFDDVELLDLSACWKDIALSPASVEATGAGRWRQKLSAPDDQLDFELRYMAQKAHVRIETAIQDRHRPARDRSLQVQFVLPVNAVGWTWDDDGRRRRTIATAETVYENSFAAGGSRISRYPFTSIARGQVGLSLGAPLDCPRMQNFLCSP